MTQNTNEFNNKNKMGLGLAIVGAEVGALVAIGIATKSWKIPVAILVASMVAKPLYSFSKGVYKGVKGTPSPKPQA